MLRNFLMLFVTLCVQASAQEGTLQIDSLVDAVGGKQKLLTAFRMEEFYNSGELAAVQGSKDRTPRASVIKMPSEWIVGGKERGTEPGKEVVRAWSLELLTNPKSKIAKIEDLVDRGVECEGIEISGSVEPAMKLFFDKQTRQLYRVDWREDFYLFSDWQEVDGLRYASKTVIYKIASVKAWFHHEISKLERLENR